MAAVVAVTVGLSLGVLVAAMPSGSIWTTAVDDLVQLAAPGLASVLCVRAARRADGLDRRLWWWLAAATASWAAGQAVWSWYELVLEGEAPFPSPADVGYLLFPLLAATGLLLWRPGPYLSGVRDIMDGALLAGALLMVSWKTALGSVIDGGAELTLAYLLSIAYPVGALVSATVVLLIIARTGITARPYVGLLAAGLLSLAVADSAYAYLVAIDAYSTGNAISTGWVTGFLLVAASAQVARRSTQAEGREDDRAGGLVALPYIAVAVALGLFVHTTLGDVRPPVPEVALATGLTMLLLARQYLVLRDNDRLLAEVRLREAALAHEVMHDGLTGLSNRAMLLQRLDQVVAAHHRDRRGLVVMFCDLDSFKGVNDTYGHLAGDGVLREVALRLRAGVRASDTVARPSGDEFAVLMESPQEDPLRVAGRLIGALTEEIELPEGMVRTGVSIGIAVIPAGAGGDDVTARSLIAAADSAMYSAKASGRNQAVLVEVGVITGTEATGAARPGALVGQDPRQRRR